MGSALSILAYSGRKKEACEEIIFGNYPDLWYNGVKNVFLREKGGIGMTIFGITVSMAVVWLVLAVIFLIIEGITVGLATIWFAAGAFVALLLSLFDVPVMVQAAVFLIVSLVLLFSTRKIFVEKLKAGSEKTNVDALIGREGMVTAGIAPFAPGQVKVGGQIWTAVGPDPELSISEGTLIQVQAVEGVKLVVAPKDCR